MTKLRHHLYDSVNNVFNNFISNIESTEITENGALQLIFDYMFLTTVLKDTKKSSISQNIIEPLQDQVIIYHLFFIALTVINDCLYRLTQLIGIVTNPI